MSPAPSQPAAPNAPFHSLDGHRRRRIYLLRHADVSYMQSDGTPVTDPRAVPLTDKGRESAQMTAQLLADVVFDRAICSGLPRTVETATLVMGDRSEPRLEMHPALEELRGGGRGTVNFDPVQAAYSLWDAGLQDSRYLGGEDYRAAAARAQNAMVSLLSEGDWNCMLAVCHGIINRLILAWALGIPLGRMAPFEQDPCGINILDFDLDEHGKIRRLVLRGANITARETAKASLGLTTLEEMAASFMQKGSE